MAGNVKQIPDGYHTVTPYIRVRGAAKAIEFYKRAFGAEEICRMPGPDGQTVMHAEIRIGNSPVMMSDEFPEWNSVGPQTVGNTTGGLHLYVADADASFAKAVAAGA
jgi:PhnB protein